MITWKNLSAKSIQLRILPEEVIRIKWGGSEPALLLSLMSEDVTDSITA
jgi:hypothetical protein